MGTRARPADRPRRRGPAPGFRNDAARGLFFARSRVGTVSALVVTGAQFSHDAVHQLYRVRPDAPAARHRVAGHEVTLALKVATAHVRQTPLTAEGANPAVVHAPACKELPEHLLLGLVHLSNV